MLGSAAQYLARRGLAVFPCVPQAKEPATANGFYDATTDASIIAAWWRQRPDYNIGVAMGHVSGIFLLDVDNHGGDGESELKKLEAEYGNLPPTVEAISGSGGRHMFFKMPDADLRNSTSGLAPGLDVKANGGYALMAPSLHPCGRRYSWSVDSVKAFAAAPQWLIDKIAALSPKSNGGNGMTPDQWCELIRDIPEGRRNNSLAKIVGHLLRRRVDPLVVVEIAAAINAARCTPPLPADEVMVICNSIAARELKRRLPA